MICMVCRETHLKCTQIIYLFSTSPLMTILSGWRSIPEVECNETNIIGNIAYHKNVGTLDMHFRMKA